jgi:glutamine cyclotransferase
VVCLLLVFCVVGAEVAWSQTPVCSYQVINTYPHDDEAFTQGLLYADGELFESTGLYGESSLRRVALETGQVLQHMDLDAGFFAEGLAMWEDRLLQLTWQENICFIWDAGTFASGGSFTYTGEGWGLTHDGHELIMSDGSSVLSFRDSGTFVEVRTIEVTDGALPIDLLNELEWIRGEVFANRFLTDRIARIDPDTGEVIAWIDLTGLLDPAPSGTEVLNGIAWDEAGERLFVTGKFWPSLFEIELVGCPELRLFYDGFESGGLSRWSLVTE